jgi:hypothetical protein
MKLTKFLAIGALATTLFNATEAKAGDGKITVKVNNKAVKTGGTLKGTHKTLPRGWTVSGSVTGVGTVTGGTTISPTNTDFTIIAGSKPSKSIGGATVHIKYTLDEKIMKGHDNFTIFGIDSFNIVTIITDRFNGRSGTVFVSGKARPYPVTSMPLTIYGYGDMGGALTPTTTIFSVGANFRESVDMKEVSGGTIIGLTTKATVVYNGITFSSNKRSFSK